MRWSTAMKPAARRKRARHGCAAVQRYPKQRLAWQRLQQILEHTQQLQEETGVWARMARHFPLSVRNVCGGRKPTGTCSIRARPGRSSPAWIPARSASRSSGACARALAWALEQDDDARAAYERMLALDIRLNSSDEDQLIALYRDSNPKQALQVLIGSWQRSAIRGAWPAPCNWRRTSTTGRP